MYAFSVLLSKLKTWTEDHLGQQKTTFKNSTSQTIDRKLWQHRPPEDMGGFVGCGGRAP